MAFQIGSNFSLQQSAPLDVRMVVSNQTERNALVTYPGLIVYITSENKYYYYNGTSWIELNITGGGGGTANFNFTIISSSQTLTKNTRVTVDTSLSSFTINLPTANLVVGDTIEIIDYKDTFDINNLIIAGAPTVIENSSAGLTCNIKGAHFLLIWLGAPFGWKISIIDSSFSKAGVVESSTASIIPLIYLEIEGNPGSELFDSPDSQNFKIPWNKIQWLNDSFSTTGVNIDTSKIVTYNPINKNIYLHDSGIYNVDLRYGSFNLIDANDFLRARLRASDSPITGGLADPSAPAPKLPLSQINSNIPILASFAQGPIGTSFNGEAMQAGFTTFEITGRTYIVADFLHFGAFNTQSLQPFGYPINNNDFGNQPFMFLTKIR